MMRSVHKHTGCLQWASSESRAQGKKSEHRRIRVTPFFPASPTTRDNWTSFVPEDTKKVTLKHGGGLCQLSSPLRGHRSMT